MSADLPERIGARVAAALDGAKRPVLVVTDLPLPDLTDLTDLPDRVTVIGAGEDKPEGNVRTVLVAAADRADLRRTVAGLGRLGWARVVAVALADDDRALTLRPDPAWPALVSVDAEVGWTRVELERGLEVTPVLRALARGATPAGTAGDHDRGGLRVGRRGEGFTDPATTVPPDVVVDPPGRPVVSECTGRAPATVTAADQPVTVDEAVFNPIGWRRDRPGPVVDLPVSARLSPALVRDLRDATGARLAPGADPELLAGLAMSGVPVLVADPADRPDWLPAPEDGEVSLHDLSRREELSVRQRRAALLHASLLAAHARLAVAARVRARTLPSVSVVVAVRGPDRLAAALGRATQLHRALPDGGALDVELVVDAHGATPDPDLVEAAAELGGLPVRTVPDPSDTSRPPTHELVLAVDDTDVYGPDLLLDLLLARRYSGADVVGPAASPEDAETWGPVHAGPRLHARGWAPRDPGATAYRTHGLGVVRDH